LSQGYGQVTFGGKNRRVQRLFYEQFKGPIPESKELHHCCDNINCVNPAHLVAVSPKEHRRLHYGKPEPAVERYRRIRAAMTPEQIVAYNARARTLAKARRERDPEYSRALARAKYARRRVRAIARDPEGYRAKRRVAHARYPRRKRDRLWGFVSPERPAL
jgi:hypothetical protein